MQELFDNLAAISRLVDEGAWEEADRQIRRHSEMVKARFVERQQEDERWRELMRRQRALSLKFSALHSDVAQCIDDLRRSRAAARRYLSETAS